MDRFKARRTESLDLGLCTYSGCESRHEVGRVLCRKHLKKEAARNKARRETRRLSTLPPFTWVG